MKPGRSRGGRASKKIGRGISKQREATGQGVEGRPQALARKVTLTNCQAEATLEFVFLVVKESSHG